MDALISSASVAWVFMKLINMLLTNKSIGEMKLKKIKTLFERETGCQKTHNESVEEKKQKRLKTFFERETGCQKTLDEIRQAGGTGYTHEYFYHKFDTETLKTSAELCYVKDIVKLDLAMGTNPEEIVFGCCNWCPKTKFIKALIKWTGAKTENIFKYESANGNNCLMILFQILLRHRDRPRNDLVGIENVNEIEQSVEYLIRLGDKHNLDMKKILEKTTKTGSTLFRLATRYSEKLTRALLQRSINAKSIDKNFITPLFTIRSLHEVFINAGVNPFALNHTNVTHFDHFKVSVPIPPEMTPNLFFSTTKLPCCNQNCPKPCSQDLPEAWYYKNGLIHNFKKTDLIRKGAEGAVFAGLFHGQQTAFKFVEIKDLKVVKYYEEAMVDLRRRLSEKEKLSNTDGPNILPILGHVRQQLDVPTANELGLGNCVKRFEVYITKKCDFDLAEYKKTKEPTIKAIKCIIDQLIDAQEQLQAAGVSHNDIKPENILIDIKEENDVHVYIGDFGQADKKGGTPGWTSPEFIKDRVPGETDMYSFGLVVLYVLCENAELFYAIRDNAIFEPHVTEQWYLNFLQLTEIQFILDMVKPDPVDRISVTDLKGRV